MTDSEMILAILVATVLVVCSVSLVILMVGFKRGWRRPNTEAAKEMQRQLDELE